MSLMSSLSCGGGASQELLVPPADPGTAEVDQFLCSS